MEGPHDGGMMLIGMAGLDTQARGEGRGSTAAAPVQADPVAAATHAVAQAQAAEWAVAERLTALRTRQRALRTELLRLQHTLGRASDQATRTQLGIQIAAVQETLAAQVGDADDLRAQHQAASERLIEARHAARLVHTAARRQARAQRLRALTASRKEEGHAVSGGLDDPR